MYQFLMCFEMILLGCLVITLITWIFRSKVNRLHVCCNTAFLGKFGTAQMTFKWSRIMQWVLMLCEISFKGCLIGTFTTLVHLSFMHRLLVKSEIFLSRCLKITFTALVQHSLVNCLNMLGEIAFKGEF